jgi:hypothetical protein
VRIRARKPCVLARRRLLGWKVRFISRLLDDLGGEVRLHGAADGSQQAPKVTKPSAAGSNRVPLTHHL